MDFTFFYYAKKIGIKALYSAPDVIDQATHVVMFNRTFLDVFNNENVKDLVDKDGNMFVKDMEKVVRAPTVKQKCFDYKNFKGEDVLQVKRNGLVLSVLRQLN